MKTTELPVILGKDADIVGDNPLICISTDEKILIIETNYSYLEWKNPDDKFLGTRKVKVEETAFIDKYSIDTFKIAYDDIAECYYFSVITSDGESWINVDKKSTAKRIVEELLAWRYS